MAHFFLFQLDLLTPSRHLVFQAASLIALVVKVTPNFLLNLLYFPYSIFVFRVASNPEIVLIIELNSILFHILRNLWLDILFVIFLRKLHSFSCCEAVFSKLLEIKCSISDIIISTKNVPVIHLKSESVFRSWKLDSEDHSPVERCFTILASPMSIGLLSVLVVNEATNIDIRCSFYIKCFNVFGLPYNDSNLVFLIIIVNKIKQITI